MLMQLLLRIAQSILELSFGLHDLSIAFITVWLFADDVLDGFVGFAEIALCLPLESHQLRPLSVV